MHHSVGSGSGVSCGGLYCLRQQSCRLARMVGGELQLARGGPAHVSVSRVLTTCRVSPGLWQLVAVQCHHLLDVVQQRAAEP